MLRFFLTAFILFFTVNLFAQSSLGLPHIINYNNTLYKGGRQNWSIAQDKNGIMYFGNNEGLLSFDGRYWRLFPLPNATVVRSIAISDKGIIFVGGQDELGYFTPDVNGELAYTSLLPLIPQKNRSFADVWNIEVIGENAFFRTHSQIIHYFNGQITLDKPETTWNFLSKAGNVLYAQMTDKGIYKYTKNTWEQVLSDPIINQEVISSITQFNKDTLLVSTLKKGLYALVKGRLEKIQTDIDGSLLSDRIYKVKNIDTEHIAIGTTSAGLYLINKKGKVRQRFTFEQGLQNNNIRDIYLDRDQNLWLALDYGIDYISINSPIRYINPDKENPVSSYGTYFLKNKLYIGTSNGLYAATTNEDLRFTESGFHKVPESEGQVWGLEYVNQRLLMPHEDGGFEVTGETILPIFQRTGTWLFQSTSRVTPTPTVIAGTYRGLSLLSYQDGKFKYEGAVLNTSESLRFVHYDELSNSTWISHPNRGVFKISLSEDLKMSTREVKYGQDKGLPSDLHNYLFYIKKKIVVSTPEGVYEYDKNADKFIPSSLYTSLKEFQIQYMKEGNDGNVWFVSHKKLGVLDFNRSQGTHPFQVILFPELNGKVLGGFESIYIYNSENVFIGAEKGVILLNYTQYKMQETHPRVLLRHIKVIDQNRNEMLMFGGNKSKEEQKKAVGFLFNSFHFTFSAPLYDQQEHIEFSYMLSGLDKTWSSWNNRSEKEYTNLPAGNYIFKVKSRNGIGNESAEDTYSFTVLPPWYANTIAYLIYLSVLGFSLYSLLQTQKKKLKQKHHYELGVQQLELQKKEKEVIQLKNDKLQADLKYKDKELTNMTMHLIQRGEVLSKVRESVTEIAKRQEIRDSKINFRQLLRLIKTAEQTNQDWEQFSLHFNNANEGFFNRLKEKHPDLTPNEVKLCALIRMNLLSKEIAQIIHVSIKAVEISRYRLRKKLKLESEVNLHEYLLQFTK